MPGTMSSLSRELVFLMLQYLDEEKFKETAHKLEQESGFFFNMKYFEDQVQAGEWDEVERYLSGFTKLEDNWYSMKIFFEIRKQKYLEALDRHDCAKAIEILVSDLKVFASFDEEIFKEITQLLTLEDFRQHEQLSEYGDAKSVRSIMLLELKQLIEVNPLFHNKLAFPPFKTSRLRTLINQSLNWQHQHCKNPHANPEIKTLFRDHSCSPANRAAHTPPPTNSPLVGPIPKSRAFPSTGAHTSFQPVVSPSASAIAGWMSYVNPPLPHAIEPRTVDDVNKIISWKLFDVVDSAQLEALRLPGPLAIARVVQLIYANSGVALLALDINGLHKLWKWDYSERNPSGKCTASISPQHWQTPSRTPTINDVGKTNSVGQPAACIAFSKNDSYLMSVSGGKVSMFTMMPFKVMTTFMPPRPTATFLAFHPQDDNIIAIGMDDSTIQIYNVQIDEVNIKLRGHRKRITGLAFSQSFNVLVSSGADARLCVWSIDGWEKTKSSFIQPLSDCPSLNRETKIQFHKDQLHLLVVHDILIAVYDSNLECLHMWSPKGSRHNAVITSAIYSCDGLSVYAGFTDGAVGVFDANCLRLRCFIAPSDYVPQSVACNSILHPTAIAAHPSEPSQIALGMSNGAVYVIEPLASMEAKWGAPQDNDESLPSLPPISEVDAPQGDEVTTTA